MTTPSNVLLCPQCGLAEPVQKASVIYEGNTKEWQETTGSGDSRHTVTRQAKTLLGQRLSPPAKPNAGINPKWWWWGCAGLTAFLALTFGLPLCAGLAAAVVPLIAVAFGLASSFPELNSPALDITIPAWGWAVGAICLGALLLVGALIAWRVTAWAGKQYANQQANYQQRVVDTQAETARWERALENWRNLYYCSRDDVVFLRGKRAAPSAEMQKYIYEY